MNITGKEILDYIKEHGEDSNYIITENGKSTYNHLTGFFIKLIESITHLINIEISHKKDNFIIH